jgi:hypothetical protein
MSDQFARHRCVAPVWAGRRRAREDSRQDRGGVPVAGFLLRVGARDFAGHARADRCGQPAFSFALPEAEKMKVAMTRGGRAWRGFFPVGGELTSGMPDIKEGTSISARKLGPDDPRVAGPNFLCMAPISIRTPFRNCADAIEGFMSGAERTAHAIMEGIAISLGLDAQYFSRRLHGAAHHVVSYLPLSRLGCRGRLGCGRAHRLRPPDLAGAGRQWRT